MMKILIAALPLGLTGVLTAGVLTAPAAHADERRCAGTLRAVSIDGDVAVPAGRTCTLVGTRIDGNVLVKRGAVLVAKGVRVGGNVQAENHQRVVLVPRWVNGRQVRSRVEGSVQLKQGGGGELRRNVVGSDVQLFSNRGRFRVIRNTIDGNLQCKSNSPRPTVYGNVVHGNKEGQCRGR
jgi:hypothetical protein